MKLHMCFCGFLMLVAVLPVRGGERITMNVTPSVALAPADLLVRTIIEANASNRGLRIVAESANFYRSSEIAIDGERGHRTEAFEFRHVPGGWYDIRAALLGSHGEELAYVRQQVDVVSGGGE